MIFVMTDVLKNIKICQHPLTREVMEVPTHLAFKYDNKIPDEFLGEIEKYNGR